MTIKYYHSLLSVCFFVLGSLSISAQNCAFEPCASDDCGSLNVKFSPNGGPIFCDGETIIFENTSDTGFTYFLVDWHDGTIDTFYDYADFSHVYSLSDSILCADGEIYYISVCFKGVRECANGVTCQSGSYDIGIRKKPKALFGTGDVCFGDPFSFYNLSCNALTAQWEFGDGNGSWEIEPSHTYDSLGNYIVRLIVTNTCGADTSYGGVLVVLNPEAGFTRDLGFSAYCDTLPIVEHFYNASNAYTTHTYWTILPADSTKWMFTDTLMTPYHKNISVAFLDTGTFIIQLRGWNDCGESFIRDTIRILQPPEVFLYPPTPLCDSVIVTPQTLGFSYEGPIDSCIWIFDSGIPDTINGLSFPPVIFGNSGTVRLTVHGPCGVMTMQVLVIVPESPVIAFPAIPPFYCNNAPPFLLTAQPPGGTWTGLGAAAGNVSPGGQFDPTGLTEGMYTIHYALDSIQCPVDATVSMEIREAPDFLLNDVAPACGTLLYTPEVNYHGHIHTWQWSFQGGTPPFSNKEQPNAVYYALPGNFTVILTTTGSCGTHTDSVHIDIMPPLNLSIQPPPPPLCANTPPFLLMANLPGGTWFGPGILDPVTGLFDPSIVPGGQPVLVSYYLKQGICEDTATINILVHIPEAVNIDDRTFCINNPPALLQANKPGGIWSGPGIVQPFFGLFNPVVAGIGNWVVYYNRNDPNGCAMADSATITVEEVPLITMADTASICMGPGDFDLALEFGYSATPPGGTIVWSGPGVDPATGKFNPMQAGLSPGTYKVDVVYILNGCKVTSTAVITLNPSTPLVLPPDTLVCISDMSLNLVFSPIGGTWTGPGISPNNGIIDLSAAGKGIHTYTYIVAPGTSCDQSGQVDVEIIDPADGVVAGPDLVLCQDSSSFLLGGFSPGGGLWSGPGVTDPAQGIIDLTNLSPDSTYTYLYCFGTTTPVNCNACKSRLISINPRPVIDLSLSAYPCLDMPFTITNNTGNALEYLWDFGDNQTSTEADPEHTYVQEGAYTVTLIATSALGCKDTFTQDFYVTLPPVAAFDLLVDEGCAPFPVVVVNNSSGYQITEQWLIQGDTVFGTTPGNFMIDQITGDSIIKVLLQVTNVCGTTIHEEEILVHPYPVVDFGFDVDEGCSPLTIQFANVTLGNPDDFVWDLGNGNIFVGTVPPAQIYVSNDSTIIYYPVTLISNNACGSDTLTKVVTVYPPDVQAFIQMDTLQGCQPLLIEPKNFSTPGATSIWRVYNDQDSLVMTSNSSSPSFFLNQPGWHTIILDASRCGSDADTTHVLVLPAPEVDFSHLPYICEAAPISFTNTSVNTIVYLWDFGDGTQSNQFAPVHTYTQEGFYTVTLTGYSQANNCPSTVTSILEVRSRPLTGFTASTQSGCGPLLVNFSNVSTGQGMLDYIWTFGDGSTADFSTDPTHVFSDPGSYTVNLWAHDDQGCLSDTSTVIIQVYPRPDPQIMAPSGPICVGSDSLIIQGGSPDAVSFVWTMLDQQYYTATLPWIPTEPGFVTVSLVVGNMYQCYDSSTIQLEVLIAPVAQISSDVVSGCEDLLVQFDNSSVHADYFYWNFGDQTTSTSAQTSHLYSDPGSWTATLLAYNTNGCPPDTAQLNILVHPSPEADFTMQKSVLCGVPQDVQFTNLSIKGDAWAWNFGDGNTTAIKDPLHTFTSPGQVQVELIASNIYQCRDTVYQPLEILGQPVADFDIDVTEGCSPLRVTLNNQSSQSLSYEWQVDGIGVFHEQQPELVFNEPGIYGIRLIARYTNMCQDTIDLSGIIRIYQSPEAGFTYQVNAQENVLGDVLFTNTSTDADRYFWNLGDGTTSISKDVKHAYDINGPLQVMLWAFNDNGGLYTCVDSVSLNIDPEWITTFYAPNAMTPGYGEDAIRVFRPVGIGIEEYEITVYSPWGELVWASTELEDHRPSGEWDGTYRGQMVPQGAYAWLARMRFLNGVTRVVKGTVTVLR